MDKSYPERWGDFLLNPENGQKQLEFLSGWIDQGLKGLEELSTQFRTMYGFGQTGEGSQDCLCMLKKAQEELKHSIRGYLDLVGVVPRDEYLTLAGRYDELREKLAQQEKTVDHLRLLLSDAKETQQTEATGQFNDLLRKLGEQSQKLEARESHQAEVNKQLDNLLRRQGEQFLQIEAREGQQLELARQLDEMLRKQGEQLRKLEMREAQQLEVARKLEELLTKHGEQSPKLEAKESQHADAGKQIEDLLKRQNKHFQKMLDELKDLLKKKPQPGGAAEPAHG